MLHDHSGSRSTRKTWSYYRIVAARNDDFRMTFSKCCGLQCAVSAVFGHTDVSHSSLHYGETNWRFGIDFNTTESSSLLIVRDATP
jgi:hypothetical protein